MTPAARSLMFFGWYLVGAGIALVLAPAALLGPVGLAPPADLWGRVAGVLATVLGSYYLVAARAGWLPLLRASVVARVAVALVFVVFVAAGQAPAGLLVFAAVDLAGAVWTAWALHTTATPQTLRAA